MKTVFAFIFLLVCTASCDANFVTNSLQESRAIQAYKDKKYDQALQIYNQLAANHPYDAGYNYNIGDILYKSGKFQESIPYYKRAIEHGNMQTKVQSSFNIGNVHMQSKAYDDAINSYEDVLKLDSDNQPAKHNLEIAKKLKEQKEQEDQKQDQDQKQDSQDQDDDQDEKQGQDNQQEDQKQDSSSDKNSKNKDKKSGDQKKSDQGKDQKGDSSSEKKEEKGADQKQGQKDQQKESQDQKKDASKNNTEKSDQEIEQDLAKSQKEQREKQEKQQSTPQSGNSSDGDSSEEKQVPQQLNDSLYQEMQKSAADDDRLSTKEAQLMQQMENLEKSVTKNVMKHMIRTQTAGTDDGKKW